MGNYTCVGRPKEGITEFLTFCAFKQSKMDIFYVILISLLGLSLATIPDHSQYKGHKVHRVRPEKAKHLRWLKNLQDSEVLNADFWTEPKRLGQSVDIQVAPEHQPSFLFALQELQIPHEIIIHDLESSIIDHLTAHQRARIDRKPDQREIWDDYLPYQEILDWIDQRNSDCGPTRCSVFSIGSTYEGRDMKVIKITNGDGVEKEGFWVDAGIHAREWIAPSVGLYFIDRLIDDFETDTEVVRMLENFDFYILALMNCDGYEYSHTTDRMWRKSRRPNDDVGSICYGTDVNRNFDHQWGTVGVSHDACSNTYCGPNAYSEIEAENVANYITQSSVNWRVFYTLHSYSQLWMAPWGYTTDPPENYDELIRAGTIGAEALTAVYGTEYEVGSASEILYASSGTSRDWAKGVPEIEYVYTIELRDQGEHGFLLPPEQIRPCVEETWAGIRAFTITVIDGPRAMKK